MRRLGVAAAALILCAFLLPSAPAPSHPACTLLGCLVTLPTLGSTAAPPKAPCLGDGESGKRVQLFYGQVAGQTDQSSTMIPKIQAAADTVNQAWRNAGNENVRWACNSSGETVINVLLPSATFDAATATLRSLGYTSPDRIYSIVETGPSPNGLAGQAVIPPDDRATDNLANTARGTTSSGNSALRRLCTNRATTWALCRTLRPIQPTPVTAISSTT